MKHLTMIFLFGAFLFSARTSWAEVDCRFATNAPPVINLTDQYSKPQQLSFPSTNIILLTIADKMGSDQIDGWIAALKLRYQGRIEFRGLADVAGAPAFIHGHIRKKFQEKVAYPVMLDWSGKVCAAFGYESGVANILLIERDGRVLQRFTGVASKEKLLLISKALDQILFQPSVISTDKTTEPATLH